MRFNAAQRLANGTLCKLYIQVNAKKINKFRDIGDFITEKNAWNSNLTLP